MKNCKLLMAMLLFMFAFATNTFAEESVWYGPFLKTKTPNLKAAVAAACLMKAVRH